MIVARLTDKNFKRSLYDEIIQGYPLYMDLMGEDDMVESFWMRDSFLVSSVDWIFWYANSILLNQSRVAFSNKEKLIVLD